MAARLGRVAAPLCQWRAPPPAPPQCRSALQEVKWHAGDDAALERLDLGSSRLAGLALNVQSGWLLSRLLGGRHWVALKKVEGRWWATGAAGLGRGWRGGRGGGGSLAGPLHPRRTTQQLARPCWRRHNLDSCLKTPECFADGDGSDDGSEQLRGYVREQLRQRRGLLLLAVEAGSDGPGGCG
jgi:hypothetical protein